MSTASPSPSPSSSLSADALGDRIATLFFRIHAATYELLTLLRDFDDSEAWSHQGFKSCGAWLSWRTGCAMGPAREKVRVAKALADLPRTSEAMAKGELSFCVVRELTRVATAENEDELLLFARHGTVSQVTRLIRAWKRIEAQEDAEDEKLRHASRYLRVSPSEDGMYEVRGRLDPEVGAMLMKAVEEASRALFEQNPDEGVEQRRADALGRILREGGTETEVVVHVTEEGTRTEEGVHVPYGTSERLCCEATVVEVTKDGEGNVLDVGRRRRTPPPRMRRALEMRDEGCRFPGCGSRASHCESHHVEHWRRGGATKLANLVLLCRFHHRLVHEEGFGVELREEGEAVFTTPLGVVIPVVGEGPASEAAASGPTKLDVPHGIGPDTGRPLWSGIRPDYNQALAYFLADREVGSPLEAS